MVDSVGNGALLRLQDIRKTFQMGELSVEVLKGLSLDIPDARLTAIIGPSGSGKSTLLNIVGGIDYPSTGQVWFDGQDLAQASEEALTEYRRTSVGFVFQFYNLVPTLTALENVRVSTEIAEQPMPPDEALKLVELGHRLDHFPAQLSGGEQQRVSIARAIAGRPRLLLCDEPTGALDFNTGKLVLSLLSRLNREQQLTVVIITHNNPIADMAHRVIRLGSGVIAELRDNDQPGNVEEISW